MKSQELSYPDVNAKPHDSIRKMLASFADTWRGKMICNISVKHRIELTLSSHPFR